MSVTTIVAGDHSHVFCVFMSYPDGHTVHLALHPLFTDEETEVRVGKITCRRPHGQCVPGLGLAGFKARALSAVLHREEHPRFPLSSVSTSFFYSLLTHSFIDKCLQSAYCMPGFSFGANMVSSDRYKWAVGLRGGKTGAGPYSSLSVNSWSGLLELIPKL